MENVDITVIIPNYNNEAYIEQCVMSVYNQTYKRLKILVVDDCSTDDSTNILSRLENRLGENFEVIYLKENKGVSAARNIGLMRSNTEFVTFLDGDDFYYNFDKISNEVALKKMSSSNAVVYSKIIYVSQEGKIIKYPPESRRRYISGKRKAFIDFMTGNKMDYVPRDYVIDRKILLEMGGYSFWKDYYEDWDLLIRLSFKCEFVCTYEIGTAYRNTANGLSKKSKEESRSTLKEMRMQYRKHMRWIDYLYVIPIRAKLFCLKVIYKTKQICGMN